MKKKIELVKTVGGIMVSIGVTSILENMIKSTTNPFEKQGVVKHACVSIATIVLAGVISETATKYMEQKIDLAVSETKKIVKESEEVA